MKQLKFAARYIARHWWQYLLGIAALFIVDRVNALVPQLTGELIDGLGGPAPFGAAEIRGIVLRAPRHSCINEDARVHKDGVRSLTHSDSQSAASSRRRPWWQAGSPAGARTSDACGQGPAAGGLARFQAA